MAPTIYMIRHGEKPPQDADGLSAEGVKRAQYLPQVFGQGSTYNIGYILAEHPKKDGSRERPSETVEPLAASLGLKIHMRDRDDAAGAAEAARSFAGPGDVLVCWEHGQLARIAAALGVTGFTPSTGWSGDVVYPGSRFDLVWVVPPPYTEVVEVRSEGVPVLDDGLTGKPSEN